MFSFYYEKREGPRYQEYKAQVRQILGQIKAGKYEPYTSPYATDEIEGEKDPMKREKMKGLVKEYGVTILERTEEVERLAALYIREKVISPEWPADAAYIAITVINGLDFIVSLNFTHIARPWTIEMVRRVNSREEYKGVGIYKPAEVLEL
jgi:hypothetical protein